VNAKNLPPIADRYFEDYEVGFSAKYGAEVVTEGEIIEFASRYDPQGIHTDPVAAKDGPFGGLIASGWHTTAIMMRIFATEFLNGNASLASPGIDELRWLLPVRPGDVLSARCEVQESKPSRSKPDRGLIRTLVSVENDRGEPVMTLLAMSILRRRPAHDS
jgi:acyl dehydratase